jgi:hypothetical protein
VEKGEGGGWCCFVMVMQSTPAAHHSTSPCLAFGGIMKRSGGIEFMVLYENDWLRLDALEVGSSFNTLGI